MNNEHKPKGKLPFHKRTITITMAPARIVSVALIFLAIISWFFFLGLIIGRGQYPENTLPSIGRIMPKANATTEIAPRILSDNNTEAPEPVTTPTNVLRLPTPAKPLANSHDNNTSSQKPSSSAAALVQAGSNKEAIFNYTYQVASFKEPVGSKALAEKLKKDGLKARVATSKTGKVTWYRVMVDFRGTPTQTEQLRDTLAKHKITKILMVTKKPVTS